MARSKTPTKVLKKDLFYVQQAAKRCKYVVDIEMMRVNVPLGEEPDEIASLLQREKGFQIQYVLDDEVELNEDIFDPEFSTGAPVEVVHIPEPEFRRYEEFKTREGKRLRIFDRKKNTKGVFLTMQVIGDMSPNYPIELEKAERKVKSKAWVFIPGINERLIPNEQAH